MSTYSTSLGITLIGTGEQAGTWGNTTNTNLGTLLEQAITGVVNITMTDADYTLTKTNGVSDEARNAVILVGGANTAVQDLIVPLVEKLYVIKNATTGGFAIKVRSSSGLGTDVTIPNGMTTLVFCDGAPTGNVYEQVTGAPVDFTVGNDLNVGGDLNVTGAVTGTVTATLDGSTINVDDNTVSGIAASSFVVTDASGNIDGAAAQKAIPTGAVVGTTDVQQLSGKRVDPRYYDAIVNTATPLSGLSSNDYDIIILRGQATNITSMTTGFTGTPTDGQKLWIAITATSSKSLTWGALFQSSGNVTLPTSINSTRLDIGFVWNVASNAWRCVAYA